MELGLKATNEQQDNGTGVLHQVAQHPRPAILIDKAPKQDLEGQGTGCRVGRPVCPSKPPTPCSEMQLKCAGNEIFTNSLSGASNAGPSRCEANALSTSSPHSQYATAVSLPDNLILHIRHRHICLRHLFS